MTSLLVLFQVYNDADILEKIMKDRRRDLGPVTDDDDMMSPKLKIRMLLFRQFGFIWQIQPTNM